MKKTFYMDKSVNLIKGTDFRFSKCFKKKSKYTLFS